MRGIAILALCALLGACASAPSTRAKIASPAGVPAQLSWAQRQARLLQDVDHFTLTGRLAASNGHQGESMSVYWRQQGADAELSLTGPLGFGGAQVQLADGLLTITTGGGRHLTGGAAGEQLVALLGFDPPLRSLRYWVLGVNDPLVGAAPSLDARQRLTQLRQEGWRIDYDEYFAVGGQWLPRRLTLSHDDLRLKLVINAWQL